MSATPRLTIDSILLMEKFMGTKKALIQRASAVSLAFAGMLMAGSLNAGVINNSNPDSAAGFFRGDCGTVGSATACVGAWNLGNVEVKLLRLIDGTPFGTFDEVMGSYTPMVVGDSFASFISDGDNAAKLMGKVSGKVWPVGEPTGIKAVTGDTKTSKGKPQNCLINTSFLGVGESASLLSAYLDTAHPEPVICSSNFQTHKRFKVAMLPGTVDGVAPGAVGSGIDMVFNVADEDADPATLNLRPYQVFSKINNYTDKRLKGYKIVVGRGLGAAFRSASDLGIADKLHISLGVGEGATGSAAKPTYDGSDLFDGDGLATFSHGLFGSPDEHFDVNGFFDTRTAGFNVAQTCTKAGVEDPSLCSTTPGPIVNLQPTSLMASDTIYSTSGVLPSNYPTLFGDWLPSIWQPKGIFFDDDGDPTTDAQLMAWWNGSAWLKNNDSGFAVVSSTELNTWAANPLYAVDDIEDVLNLGINYIVKVGDINAITNGGPDFTVRIIPIVADTQVAPAWMAAAAVAPPLVVDPIVVPAPTTTTPTSTVPSSGGGGGCTTATGDTPFDPVLPLLAAFGLIGLGVRRLRRQ